MNIPREDFANQPDLDRIDRLQDMADDTPCDAYPLSPAQVAEVADILRGSLLAAKPPASASADARIQWKASVQAVAVGLRVFDPEFDVAAFTASMVV